MQWLWGWFVSLSPLVIIGALTWFTGRNLIRFIQWLRIELRLSRLKATSWALYHSRHVFAEDGTRFHADCPGHDFQGLRLMPEWFALTCQGCGQGWVVNMVHRNDALTVVTVHATRELVPLAHQVQHIARRQTRPGAQPEGILLTFSLPDNPYNLGLPYNLMTGHWDATRRVLDIDGFGRLAAAPIPVVELVKEDEDEQEPPPRRGRRLDL